MKKTCSYNCILRHAARDQFSKTTVCGRECVSKVNLC